MAKPSLLKKSERRLLGVFNNKSWLKIAVFAPPIFLGAGYGASTIVGLEVSEERGPQGAAHVAQYQRELSDLSVKYTRSVDANGGDAPPELRRETRKIAYRIAMDDQISERDADRLVDRFNDSLKTDSRRASVDKLFTTLDYGAIYLKDARVHYAQNKDDPAYRNRPQAAVVLDMASRMNNRGANLFMPLWFMLIGAGYAGLGMLGSRHDKLVQQERSSAFGDVATQLKTLLKPKTP